MSYPSPGEPPAPRPRVRLTIPAAAALCGIFLALAVVFWKGLIPKGPPLDAIGKLEERYYSTATVRKVRKEMTFDGMPCQSCHDGKEPLQGNPQEKGVFHEKIELKHGRNRHCFNCHHRLQPATFADYDGTPISLAKIETLCAKCHGTTYRDWNSGAHGRRSGHWDPRSGESKKTVCIACHEPHWPVFKAFAAAPAPRVNPRTLAAAPGHGAATEGGR